MTTRARMLKEGCGQNAKRDYTLPQLPLVIKTTNTKNGAINKYTQTPKGLIWFAEWLIQCLRVFTLPQQSEEWQQRTGDLECPKAEKWATIQFIIFLQTLFITGCLNIQRKAVFGIRGHINR
ncbi:MAG: hypothetical protein ABSA74_01005 [Candidatus Staskawiczbacteria bacterium]